MIDAAAYPLPAQRQEAFGKRRIGLGITGLADALILSGLHYASDMGIQTSKQWTATIERTAFLASAEIAAEKGAFPAYDIEGIQSSYALQRQPKHVREKVKEFGLRNGLLTSIAPTGTISMLAGNISSGIEPIFQIEYERRIVDSSGTAQTQVVQDYSYRIYRQLFGMDAPLPDTFATATALAPSAHLRMQSALQQHIDSSISKTINCPEEIPYAQFQSIYVDAYELGLKGCTTFRPSAMRGSVMQALPASRDAPPVGFGILGINGDQGQQGQSCVFSCDAGGAAVIPLDVSRASQPNSALGSVERYDSKTYNIPAGGDANVSIRLTITDKFIRGHLRPAEIILHSTQAEHIIWCQAISGMLSAVLRRGGDVRLLTHEARNVRIQTTPIEDKVVEWLNGIADAVEAHINGLEFSRREQKEVMRMLANICRAPINRLILRGVP